MLLTPVLRKQRQEVPGVHCPAAWTLGVLGFLLLQRNTMTKEQVEERVYLAFTSAPLFITEGSRGKNSNRNLCKGHGGVLLVGLLILHCYRTQDNQPRDSITRNRLAPPHQSLINGH